MGADPKIQAEMDRLQSLSDEDFLKEPLPKLETSADLKQPSETVTEEDLEEQRAAAEGTPEETPEEPEVPEEPDEEETPSTGSEEAAAAEAKDQPFDEKKDEEKKPEEKKTPEVDVDSLKSFYEAVTREFKANGKTVRFTDPEDIIRLMQMGSNYTQKMQAFSADRKFVMMLENAGIKDESSLSFLIDLNRKDPEAIKKLLKDANVDPMEIDMSEQKYQAGNHVVSDHAAALDITIKEIESLEDGEGTLQSVMTWDQKSKEEVFKDPSLLHVFHGQRTTGVYDQIVNVIDQWKMVGRIPASMPFLSAYRLVGDALVASGDLNAPSQRSNPTQVSSKPPVVRPVKAQKKVTDSRVKAASPTRTSSSTAKPKLDLASLSDDDFMKALPQMG